MIPSVIERYSKCHTIFARKKNKLGKGNAIDWACCTTT